MADSWVPLQVHGRFADKIDVVKLRAIVAVCGLFGASCALNPEPQQPRETSAPIVERSVRSQMRFLASDALNGRGSGTRDEWIAVAYAASQMQQWGLEPLGDAGGFVQQIEIERTETTAAPVLSYDRGRVTHGTGMRVQLLSAAHVSGGLQKYTPGTPVRPGAILLMPASPAGQQSPGTAASAGVAAATS